MSGLGAVAGCWEVKVAAAARLPAATATDAAVEISDPDAVGVSATLDDASVRSADL